jgi:mRNA interferase MazF
MGEIQRGEIWWADLPEPRRSEPGYRRPVLVVQADSFNLSRIQTAIVAAIATNVELADAPGNVLLPARSAALSRDSVVNVSQLLTLDRSFLTEHAGTLPPRLQRSSMKACARFCNSRNSNPSSQIRQGTSGSY